MIKPNIRISPYIRPQKRMYQHKDHSILIPLQCELYGLQIKFAPVLGRLMKTAGCWTLAQKWNGSQNFGNFKRKFWLPPKALLLSRSVRNVGEFRTVCRFCCLQARYEEHLSFLERQVLSVSVLFSDKAFTITQRWSKSVDQSVFQFLTNGKHSRPYLLSLYGLETDWKWNWKKEMKILTFLNGKNLIPQTTRKSAIMQN